MIFLLEERDKSEIKEKENKIKKELSLDYPKIITKLLIYVNAGMTIRNSFLRIGDTYIKKIKTTNDRRKAYDEIVLLNNKIKSGYNELNAIYDMSKNINDRNYTRFFNILIQNIKNGNKDLRNILSMEAYDALYERKNNAKKLGEEAATKLILPLMIMLVIIMLVIMVPALSNM